MFIFLGAGGGGHSKLLDKFKESQEYIAQIAET